MTAARGILALVGVTVTLVTLLTVTWLGAESLGLTDERFLRDRLLALGSDGGGRPLVALAVGLLLAADLVLPVPSSLLMTLSGFACGIVLGATASFAGAMASAWIGYFACRRFGREAFLRLVGERDVAPIERFVSRYGAWAVLLSRPVPMLTEVTSCVAGLAGLPPRRFSLLAAAGTLPVCAVYAWAGATAQGDASLVWPLAVGLVIPAAGFLVLLTVERRRRRRQDGDPAGEERYDRRAS